MVVQKSYFWLPLVLCAWTPSLSAKSDSEDVAPPSAPVANPCEKRATYRTIASLEEADFFESNGHFYFAAESSNPKARGLIATYELTLEVSPHQPSVLSDIYVDQRSLQNRSFDPETLVAVLNRGNRLRDIEPDPSHRFAGHHGLLHHLRRVDDGPNAHPGLQSEVVRDFIAGLVEKHLKTLRAR